MATIPGNLARPATRAPGRAAHFPLLDAGRGVAALAVVVHHLGIEAGVGIARHGHLAVDYFLMLSGFVVAMSYEGRLRGDGAGGAARGRMGFREFLGVRAKRLYPMIFVGAVLATAAYALAPNPDIRPVWVVLQFLLLPAVTGWVLFPLNAPMWSLFYESVANVAHGSGLAFVRTRAIAVAVVVLGVMVATIAGARGDYNWGFRPEDAGVALVRVFAAYLAGVLIWRLHSEGRLPVIRVPGFVPMALVLAPLLAPAGTPAVAVTLAALFLCFPASILCSLEGRERPGSVPAWLGGISYPLYAIHMPILIAWHRIGPDRGLFGWLCAGLIAVAAAWAAERWIDAPIRAALRARKRSRNAAPRVHPA